MALFQGVDRSAFRRRPPNFTASEKIPPFKGTLWATHGGGPLNFETVRRLRECWGVLVCGAPSLLWGPFAGCPVVHN